ncbi:fimbrial protein pilin [Beggiatoa sp. PS]|nr:fimbrial protein pilin [Beggiatoa sp. PS]
MKTRLKIVQGFTLIELMIVIAIIGIFAAIAYPSYQSSIRKSRRADAKTALADLAQVQENFFVRKNRYAQTFTELESAIPSGFTTVDDLNLISKDDYYNITLLPFVSTRSFTLRATAREGTTQANDVDCQTFSINHQGLKESSPKTDCW